MDRFLIGINPHRIYKAIRKNQVNGLNYYKEKKSNLIYYSDSNFLCKS